MSCPAVIKVVTPGPPGPAGATGVGAAWQQGSGVPGAGVGANGDFYLDAETGDIYGPKTAGAWGAVIFNIAEGQQGPAGAAGVDGRTVLSGSGAPGGGVGANGDFFIDTTGWVIYGPKAAGAWPAGASLVGPASLLNLKGTVANEAALPSSGNTIGDVWQAEDTGEFFVWDGTGWDGLGDFGASTAAGPDTDLIIRSATINGAGTYERQTAFAEFFTLAEVDLAGAITRAVRPDGSHYLPKAAIDSLTVGSLVVTGSSLVNTPFTRAVSPTGNDANDGSESSPWLTFTRLKAWINALPANSAIRVIVKTGTYSTTEASPLYFQVAGLSSEVFFEQGVAITMVQSGSTTLSNAIGADRGEHYFYLNGAMFTLSAAATWPTISDNGVGVHGGKVFVDGYTKNKTHASFVGFIDGLSNHNDGYLDIQGVDFSACPKGAFVHVTTSRSIHRDCNFTGLVGSVYGIGGIDDAASADFYYCKFLPDPTATAPQSVSLRNGVAEHCQFGATSQSVQLVAINMKVRDSYLNVVQNREHGNTTYMSCFGKYTNLNTGANANEARLLTCVFVGAGSFAPSNRFFASSVGFGKFFIYNTILSGYEQVIDVGGNAGRIAAVNAWAMNGLCLFGNTANFDPGINIPSIVVSANPALGAANTVAQADYEIGAGSPCRYAGVNLGNIGLPRETP